MADLIGAHCQRSVHIGGNTQHFSIIITKPKRTHLLAQWFNDECRVRLCYRSRPSGRGLHHPWGASLSGMREISMGLSYAGLGMPWGSGDTAVRSVCRMPS